MDIKWSYIEAQFRGVRPYGVSLLVAGWDNHRGPSLYQVDPSGSFWAWKASAIGKNMINAKTFLEKRCVTITALTYLFFGSNFGYLQVQRRHQPGRRNPYCPFDTKRRVRGTNDRKDHRNWCSDGSYTSRTGTGKNWRRDWAAETNIQKIE